MVAHLANTTRATSLVIGARVAEVDEAAGKAGDATRNGINPHQCKREDLEETETTSSDNRTPHAT